MIGIGDLGVGGHGVALRDDDGVLVGHVAEGHALRDAVVVPDVDVVVEDHGDLRKSLLGAGEHDGEGLLGIAAAARADGGVGDVG